MQACALTDTPIVALLMEKGADTRATDDKGFTALLVAAYSGKAATVALLLDKGGADPNDADKEGHSALMGAAFSGDDATVETLLRHGANARASDKDGFTALMIASGKGSIQTVKRLLLAGADVNAPTAAGFTPLMQASGAERPEVARLLIDNGASVEAVAKKGATALLVAAYASRTETARLLLDKGARVDAADAAGHTPLIGAAFAGSTSVATLLLDRGANREAATKAGLTALMQAAYSGRADAVKFLLSRGAVVDARTSHGLTALMQAAGTGNQVVCRLLLESGGADINATDETGQTAVTWARKRGHDELIGFLKTAGARAVPDAQWEAARVARDRAVKAAGTNKAALADVPPLPKDGDAAPPEPEIGPHPPAPSPAARERGSQKGRAVGAAVGGNKRLPSPSEVGGGAGGGGYSAESALTLHGPRIVGCSPGKPFLYRIGATGGGAGKITYSATNLPPGLTIAAGTGIVSGKIAAPGTYTGSVTAKSGGTTVSRLLTIDCYPGHLSPTPPMGWSAWSLYGETVTADKVKLQADWLVKSGLAAHGFNYVLLDDTWQGRRDEATGSLPPNRRLGSIAALADYCHARGLKFGIYSSPNAETPAGYAGSEGHEAQDAQQWASSGVDYVKYDWSDASRGRFDVTENDLKAAFGKMRKALDATNRDIHFAVTPYGLGGVTDWGAAPVKANSWWTSRQVIESWDGVRHNGFELSFRAAPAGPNHWNDPGWLLLGRIGNAAINPHFTTLTPDEQKTQLSLWCLTASPLILSCDLTQLDPNRFYRTTSALLTNDEVLDIDQDPLGSPATRLDTSSGSGEVWARPLSGGGVAVGLFNRDGTAHPVSVLWSDFAEMLGGADRVPKADAPVRDLWKHAPLPPEARVSASGGGITVTVPAHGVVLVTVGGSFSEVK